MFDDLLAALTPNRRAHSLEVGRKAAAHVIAVAPRLRADLVAAATLHDIGYGHPATGFHPLDGAHFLRGIGFSPVVCHLVAYHSASTLEAEVRGIAQSAYEPFALDDDPDLAAASAVLWWADMTTGPTGNTVAVEDRLVEIESRYGAGDPVTEFIGRAREVLLAAGQSPSGSM